LSEKRKRECCNVATDSRTGALGLTSEYDVEGRLSKVYQTNNSAEGATYAYDARGRLSSRTVTHATAPTSTTTVYVHDLNDHIIAELDASGQTQREYIWLDDMPVAVADNVASGNPVIYFVHVDHLMRPARMTAQDTSWVWDVIYAPFGGVSYIWSNPANIDLRFPGQWFQLESGLAYNWHRHYDATLGRYVQPDQLRNDNDGSTLSGLPLEDVRTVFGLSLAVSAERADAQWMTRVHRALLPDGPNINNYARQSPISNIDADGLETRITGFRKHGINQIINRGISPGAILDAINNPIKIKIRPNGTTQYCGSDAVIVLNPGGEVVTAWPQ